MFQFEAQLHCMQVSSLFPFWQQNAHYAFLYIPTPVLPHASTKHQAQAATITSAASPTAQPETKYYTIYTFTIGPALALAGIILVTVVSIYVLRQTAQLRKSLKYPQRNEASSPPTGMRVSTGKHLLELDKPVHFMHQIKLLVTLSSQNCIGCNAPWFVGRLQLSCTSNTYSLDTYEPWTTTAIWQCSYSVQYG